MKHVRRNKKKNTSVQLKKKMNQKEKYAQYGMGYEPKKMNKKEMNQKDQKVV